MKSVTHRGFWVLCGLPRRQPRPPHLGDSNKQHLRKRVDGGMARRGRSLCLCLSGSVLLLPIFAAHSLGREAASKRHWRFQFQLRNGRKEVHS